MNKICRTRKWMWKKWDKEITAKRMNEQKVSFGVQLILAVNSSVRCSFFTRFSVKLRPMIVCVYCWFDKQWDEICNVMWRVLGIFPKKITKRKRSRHVWMLGDKVFNVLTWYCLQMISISTLSHFSLFG